MCLIKTIKQHASCSQKTNYGTNETRKHSAANDNNDNCNGGNFITWNNNALNMIEMKERSAFCLIPILSITSWIMTNCLNYWYLWYIFFLYSFCLFWFSISLVLRLCIIEIHFFHLLYFVQFYVLFECVVLVCHPFHFVSFRSFIPCFFVSYVWCQFNIHTCDHDMKEKTLRTIGMMMLIMLLDYPEWNIGNHKVADIMFCLDMKWSDRERKKRRWN